MKFRRRRSSLLKIAMRIFAIFLIGLCIPVGLGKHAKKILRGSSARIKDYPHQVSLRFPHFHQCGGSIIDELHVITAAHCVLDEYTIKTNIKVLSGTNDLEDDISGRIHDVAMVIQHPDYDPLIVWKNDIAILKLKSPIEFSRLQKPIDLPKKDIPIGKNAKISGWGEIESGSELVSQYLQELTMYIIPDRRCAHTFSNDIDIRQFCAVKGRGYDISDGDSGGGLIYKGTIIGIASCSPNGGLGFPAVFTRVYFYLPWIKRVIERY